MTRSAIKLWQLLDRATKKGVGWFFSGMLIASFFEMVGVGVFIPLFQVLVTPDKPIDIPGLRWVYTDLAMGDQSRFIMIFCGGLIVFFAIKAVAMAALIYLQNRFATHRQAQFSRALLAFYLSKPYAFHLERNSAELIRNVTTLAVRIFVKGLLPLMQIGMSILTIGAVLLVLVMVDPWITLGAGLILLVSGGLFYGAIHNRIAHWGEQTIRLDKDMLQAIHQALGAVKPTKLAQLEGFFVGAYHRPNLSRATYMTLSSTAPYLPSIFIELMVVVGLVTLIIVLATIGKLQEALPILGVFGIAALRLMPAFSRIVSNLALFRENTNAIDLIAQDLAETKSFDLDFQPPIQTMPETTAPPCRSIRIDKVQFAYQAGSLPVLADISLDIPIGGSTALVGRSGAGKTTLVDILMGLLHPTAGRILVDGQDTAEDLAAWQARIGYVPQEIYLTDDTLKRNIALGQTDAQIDPVRLAHAVSAAQLDEMVAALPDGLDTMVGERGARISGGQRQRIGIARALYREPSILVLDEATSALDMETERAVTEAIAALHGKLTVIVIAHRLATVRHCDTIVFMEKGRIVDAADYTTLRSRCPAFDELASIGTTD